MPNRNLTPAELAKANALLRSVRNRLKKMAGDDSGLLFAYRRKVSKELAYDERAKPAVRVRLKQAKMVAQKGRCAVCRKRLPPRGAILDRKMAVDGYTDANTRLICPPCDARIQSSRGFR